MMLTEVPLKENGYESTCVRGLRLCLLGWGGVRAAWRNGRPLNVIDGTLAASEPPTATHHIEAARHEVSRVYEKYSNCIPF